MDYRNLRPLRALSLSSSLALATGALLGLLTVAPGCYAPDIGDGAQLCAPGDKCPEGFTCFPNKRCYKSGTSPACSPACGGATPQCDLTTLKCVACLGDKDCPDGQVCTNKACVPGCNANHPTCGADAGRCDVDMGRCRGCNADNECGGATPKCDLQTGLCVTCLPADDKCPVGKFCEGKDGKYACVDGCRTNLACQRMAMMGGNPNATTCCNNRCVDVGADGMNCGACGKACGGGQGCCSGQCTDTKLDPANCGACGTVCMPKGVNRAACNGGSCAYDMCTPGFGDCDGMPQNGCEATVSNDVMNCGKCGNVCGLLANATASCVAGSCAPVCNMGFADCNKIAGDGCEVNLATDVKNCNGCGVACPVPNNAIAACINRVCGFSGCLANFGNCNGNAMDGCETPLTNDVKNCGACGKVCPAGPNQTASCVAGNCRVTCNGNFADCNGNAMDGCEVDLSSDANNCKACGMKCPAAPNAAPACAGGACGLGACNVNFSNCNGLPGDGCEALTGYDGKNCGRCGTVCAANNVCVAGACVPMRPNIMSCGATTRPIASFVPGQLMLASVSSCVPDGNTQALFITRNWANGITAQALQNYVNAGGIVITEYNISQAVWNAVFGTAAAQGPRAGSCLDALPAVNQFTPSDPFWLFNGFVAQPLNQTGCGFGVQSYPGIVPLAGWDNVNVAIGYRDFGAGRVWATDFDWQDNDVLNDGGQTVKLMGYMLSHRR